VRDLKPDKVVSSHREIISHGIEKEFTQFLQIFQKRDERILTFLNQKRTLEEIVNSALIYRDFSFHPLLLRYWEKNMVQKHLNILQDKGIVSEHGEKFERIK